MAHLNVVDVFFLGIFFLSAVLGLSRGFISEVISLATLIAAFFIATMFAQPLATYFTSSGSVQGVVSQTSGAVGVSTAMPISYLALGASFAALFIGTLLAGSVVKIILNMVFQIGILRVGNRIFGAVFGLIRALIINLVIIFLVQLSAISTNAVWNESQVVEAYQPLVTWLNGIVSPALAGIKDKFKEQIEKVGTQIKQQVH